MRGVGVPQRVDVSAFDDARFLPSTVEGALEAGIGDGADVMGQTPSQTATGRRREEPLWRTVRFSKIAAAVPESVLEVERNGPACLSRGCVKPSARYRHLQPEGVRLPVIAVHNCRWW